LDTRTRTYMMNYMQGVESIIKGNKGLGCLIMVGPWTVAVRPLRSLCFRSLRP
jgi:hypothetical protein